MIFPGSLPLKEHPDIQEIHAPLSPSQPYWLEYDRDKLIRYWDSKDAQIVGTITHSYAETFIKAAYYFREHPELNFKNPVSLIGKDSFSLHVMHSIRHNMQPEVTIQYSDICWGHADALGFDLETKTLRINDLKTGKHPGDIRQLEIYAALFFAEYGTDIQFKHLIDLRDCKVELRIFQFNDCLLTTPSIEYIIEDRLGRVRAQHEILADELRRREK